MKISSVFLTLVLSSSLFAAPERPTPPVPGFDNVLLNNKPPRQFFAERTADKACTGELAKARERYEAASSLLKDMVAKGKTGADVDAHEDSADLAREDYLNKMGDCGICTTRPIEQREIPTAGRTEIWYLSDGSCQLPTTDKAKLQTYFKRATDLLMNPVNYPHKKGGYPAIIEFLMVDPTTGAPADKFGAPGDKHPNAFMSVRGPEFLGFVNAFSYFIDNKTTLKAGEDFAFTFATTRIPRNFRAPELFHLTAGKTRKKVNQQRLTNLFGMWYVTSDGYFRYHTSADFGISLKYIEKLGRKILADTLVQTVEKVGGQTE